MASRSPLPQLLTRAWVAASLGWCLPAIADTVLVLANTRDAVASGRHLLGCLALQAWLAALLAGVAALSMLAGHKVAPRLESPRIRSALGSVGAGLLVGLGALLLVKPWELDEDRYQLGIVLPVAALLATMALGAVNRRLPPRLMAAGLGVIALALLVIDASVLPNLYRGLHAVLAYGAALAAGLAGWLLVGEIHRQQKPLARRLVLFAGALAVLGHGVVLGSLQDLRVVSHRHGAWQPKLERLMAALVDFDRDGSSGLLGADCDDFDANVRPGACEIADNGIDDNCNGLVDPAVPPAMQPQREAVASEIRTPPPDVYLVMVDTLRADYGGGATPGNFARLARESLSFTQAHTPYPSTFRAMVAMSQGRSWRYTDANAPSLAAVLVAAGYDARMSIARHQIPLGGPDDPIADPGDRLEDPFRVHDDDKPEWTAAIIADAIAESDRPGPPRFRWLHLLDPHRPIHRGARNMAPIERYREEVDHVDAQLGLLLDGLDTHERGRNAVVIVIGDHGDEYGERGGAMHGGTLYEELTHVPMLIRLPGIEPRRVAEPASLIDLPPTLSHYLGTPHQATWQGVDWLAESPGERARVLSEVEAVDNLGGQGLPAMRAVHRGSLKLIVDIDTGIHALYDLREDPGEARPIDQTRAAVTEELRESLAIWEDRPGCRPQR